MHIHMHMHMYIYAFADGDAHAHRMCMSTVGLGEQVGVVEVAVRGDLLRISVKMHVVTLMSSSSTRHTQGAEKQG